MPCFQFQLGLGGDKEDETSVISPTLFKEWEDRFFCNMRMVFMVIIEGILEVWHYKGQNFFGHVVLNLNFDISNYTG